MKTETRLAKPLLATVAPALLALLTGCQSLDGPGAGFARQGDARFGSVTALYRTAAEAGAVAMGQFGAHPTLLVRESELLPAADCPGALSRVPARCMRTQDGQHGWLPLEREAARRAPGLPVSRLDNQV